MTANYYEAVKTVKRINTILRENGSKIRYDISIQDGSRHLCRLYKNIMTVKNNRVLHRVYIKEFNNILFLQEALLRLLNSVSEVKIV